LQESIALAHKLEPEEYMNNGLDVQFEYETVRPGIGLDKYDWKGERIDVEDEDGQAAKE
jgi:hypothetical protein